MKKVRPPIRRGKEMDKRNSMEFSVLILDNNTQEVIYIEKDT